MLLDTDVMFSMTQANSNFSQIARAVEKKGKAVLLKNNHPRYIILNIDYLSEKEQKEIEKFHRENF